MSAMRGKIAAAAVTLAILAATYGLFLVYFSHGGKETPKAVDGLLDLTAWRFADDGVLPLNGEWTFYPNRLLGPEDVAFAAAEEGAPERIDVPGSWADHMPTLGTATYRLRLKIDDPTLVYGLKTSSIQLSNRIFVNGQAVGQSGIPAERERYEAVNRPYVAFFTLKPGWNDIIVQAANHEFPASSGMNEPVYFGLSAQIAELRDKAIMHDWITVTAFLIMGLYFIGLYSQRKNDPSLFVLGMLCVFVALFTSTRGERVLYAVFGSMPFWLFLRIQMLAAVGGGIGFLLYVYTAFRSFSSRRVVLSGAVVGALLAIWALFFIPRYATDVYRQLVTLYATLPLLYVIYVFVLAAVRKVEGSVYLVVAAVALNVYVLVQNANVYFAVPVNALPPFEPFLLLVMLALLMSLRFSNAFRRIEELSVQLMKADRLKDEFLARTSHEFKSPLHGILHIARSLMDDTRHPPTAEQREKLLLITSIAGRLSRLVYDILDFSKLKQGELAIDPTPVDVRSAVETQVRVYAFLGKDRNTRLVNRVPDHLPYVLADESRLSQIIGNLLDNAIKHTQNGSIVVAAAERGGLIEISVSDTGEGIDAHHLPHIFEAFQTYDDTKENRGFGLGLPIVKQLVELQKGTISVSSIRDVGTTFTFTLPIAPGGEGGGRAAVSPPVVRPAREREYALETPYYVNRQGTHTILVVDDQLLNLKVLMDALEPLGYNVIAVKNGHEALGQLAKPNRIDLVVLDLMMPGNSQDVFAAGTARVDGDGRHRPAGQGGGLRGGGERFSAEALRPGGTEGAHPQPAGAEGCAGEGRRPGGRLLAIADQAAFPVQRVEQHRGVQLYGCGTFAQADERSGRLLARQLPVQPPGEAHFLRRGVRSDPHLRGDRKSALQGAPAFRIRHRGRHGDGAPASPTDPAAGRKRDPARHRQSDRGGDGQADGLSGGRRIPVRHRG
jgi:signal transduction histidine kinase